MTLYRQYRPTRFQDLIGQSAITHTLEQALLKSRIAHAYLFSGPRGTGKTTTARIFARAVNCENPAKKDGHFEPCNVCKACQSALSGHAPDLVEIDAASNRGIEDIRQLREQVHYAPLQLSRKIYIIDEVHMLTGEAFNALLKTLEEPPAHAIFILATTELHKVPTTIRSRCQSLRFNPATVEAITQKLDQIIKAEKWDVEAGVSTLIAERADGAFRDAETILEHLATSHNPLTKAVAIDSLGVVQNELLDMIMATLGSANSTEILTLFQHEIPSTSVRPEQLITALIERFREQLYTPAAAASQTKLPRPVLVKGLEQLLEAYILQKSSPLPFLPLEIACLEICESISPNSEPMAPASQAAPLPKKESAAPAKPAVPLEPKPIPPSSSVPVVELRDAPIKDIRRAWKQASEEIARTNQPLGQMLKDTVLHSNTETDITIHVRYKFHVEKLSEKKNRTTLEQLLQELTGTAWTVHYELSDNLPKRKHNPALSSGKVNSEEAAAIFSQGNS